MLANLDSIACAKNDKLIDRILRAIHTSGALSFARFMALALYEPSLGYYTSGHFKLGKPGDFITSPEISPLFAQCVARQCVQIFESLPIKNILELGAGSGIFAYELLLELESLNALPDHYFILEISPVLRERQKTYLKTHSPHLLSRIKWLESLPNHMIGIIIANEVMDALPVHCFRIENQIIYERGVTVKENKLVWCDLTAFDYLKKTLEAYFQESHLIQPYESEINLLLPSWIQNLVGRLTQGVILLFDYGYGRKDYYHPDRQMGTLMCYSNHYAHSNPLIQVGLQDITAHVDFTTVIENADQADGTLAGFTTQASFLLSCGLLDLAEKNKLTAKAAFTQAQHIKKLIMPSQMGEVMKVMAISKRCTESLIGFKQFDRSKDL